MNNKSQLPDRKDPIPGPPDKPDKPGKKPDEKDDRFAKTTARASTDSFELDEEESFLGQN